MPDAPPPVHPGRAAGGDGPLTPAAVEAVLADFRGWLLAGGEPAPAVDLPAVVREFVALRHDVNLHTKAARAAVEKLGTPPDVREVQRPLVLALVEVADALRTARENIRFTAEYGILYPVVGPPPPRPVRGRLARWLLPAPPDPARTWQETVYEATRETTAQVKQRLAGVGDGYELSLRRVERALAAAGLEPVPAVGERFDPETMEAVALGDGPSGTVLAESRRGYRWHGELFRAAQVTVGR